jgi:hypothetical protein
MRRLVALFVLCVPATAGGQSAGQWRGPEHMWGATCGYCHDEGVGPQLRGRKLPAEVIPPIVRQGLPGMPSFHPSEIDDKELVALARWIAGSAPPAKVPAK